MFTAKKLVSVLKENGFSLKETCFIINCLDFTKLETDFSETNKKRFLAVSGNWVADLLENYDLDVKEEA